MSQITTHVLDTALGRPAPGLELALYRLDTPESSAQSDGPQRWTRLAGGSTNHDGRLLDFLDDKVTLPAGIYRMHFATGDYFSNRGLSVFYPYVDVVFQLDDDGEHYHIPLLLAPFGYSTYRGS